MNENLQAVVTSVNAILTDTNLQSMTIRVIERLVSFGYAPTSADVWVIAYSMQKAGNHVLNQINHQTIPEGLSEMAVDMMCGEFLHSKFLSGQLELTGLDLDGMISSVKLGDTDVSFDADGSDEAKVQKLLKWLMDGKGCDLLCYRKMRW